MPPSASPLDALRWSNARSYLRGWAVLAMSVRFFLILIAGLAVALIAFLLASA